MPAPSGVTRQASAGQRQHDRQRERPPPILGRARGAPAQQRDRGRHARATLRRARPRRACWPTRRTAAGSARSARAPGASSSSGTREQREQVRPQRPRGIDSGRPPAAAANARPGRPHHQPVASAPAPATTNAPPHSGQQRHPAEPIAGVRERLPQPLVVAPRPAGRGERIRVDARHLPVRRMSAPVRRCQKVSPDAGISSARAANTTNSSRGRAPHRRRLTPAPQAARPIIGGGASRTAHLSSRKRVSHPSLPRARRPCSRRREERAADAEAIEQRPVRLAPRLDLDDLEQERQREGILAAVDEHRLLGHEPDQRPALAVLVVERPVAGARRRQRAVADRAPAEGVGAGRERDADERDGGDATSRRGSRG